jgi:hypothetical protein
MIRVDLLTSYWPSRTARMAAVRWCRDRAVPERCVHDVALLASEAVSYIRRRAVPSALAMGWADVEHVVIFVDSLGGRTIPHLSAHDDVLATRIFDELTVAWGTRARPTGTRYWFRASTADDADAELQALA